MPMFLIIKANAKANVTGTARAPVFTSSMVVDVSGEAGGHLLTWATLTLYPVVEWELLHRSDQDTCQYH